MSFSLELLLIHHLYIVNNQRTANSSGQLVIIQGDHFGSQVTTSEILRQDSQLIENLGTLVSGSLYELSSGS